MNKKERSFIEFANNTPAKSEPVTLEKRVIPKLGGLQRYAKELVELNRSRGNHSSSTDTTVLLFLFL
jgi:hypothetical protein